MTFRAVSRLICSRMSLLPSCRGYRGDGIDPTARLRIYRNNLHEGFQKTLALEYPVIGRLVGSEYFGRLALGFFCASPLHVG